MMNNLSFLTNQEEVRLYLCKPNRETIAEISTAYDRSLEFNYGGIHELTFEVPYQIYNNNGDFIRNKQVDLIKGDYLVRLEKSNEYNEYFIITNPKNSTSDGRESKSITCYHKPYELKGKLVKSYTGVKTIYQALSDTLLEKTGYTIGYIDGSLLLKYREFNVTEESLLNFVNNLADLYGGIIVWDSISDKVSFYLDENLVFDEGLEITYGKYLKSLTEEENFDDVVTRLYCYGKDGLGINGVTSTGASYIEDFSYYIYPFERDKNKKVISHSNYMSDELCHALLDYKELVESQQGSFQKLLEVISKLTNSKTPYTLELDSLKNDMDFIEKQIAVWVSLNKSLTINSIGTLEVQSGARAAGTITITVVEEGNVSKTIQVKVEKNDTLQVVTSKTIVKMREVGYSASLNTVNEIANIQFQAANKGILSISTSDGGTGALITGYSDSLNGLKETKQYRIDAKQNQIDVIDKQIKDTFEEIERLKELLSIKRNFTNSLVKEWKTYIKEQSWTDSNYIDANDLLEMGTKRLKEVSQPIVAYEIDSVDFKSASNTSHDWNKAKLGGVISIYYPNFNIDIKTKIINMDWDIDGKGIKLTIANTSDIKSGILKLKDLMQNMVSTSTTLNISKESWDKGDEAYQRFMSFIGGNFDANKQAVQAGTNQNYTLDKYGLTLKDPNDPMNFLRGLHNILAFTNDGGKTYKHAITPNGIIGESIIGTIGVFAKVYASSIIIGEDNIQIPDTLISSADEWNKIYDDSIVYSDEMLRAAKAHSDTNLVSANGHTNTINTAIRNDLRLTSALPTSIALNQNGITATTTSDPLKFARLDHRGLYIQNGALQITSTDGTTIINGSGVNASKIYTGSLNGIHMAIGTGNSVFKADTNGIYLGSSLFAAAPFRVDMNGNVTANNITLKGTINSSTMNNSNIIGGTLTIGSGSSIFKADPNGIYLGSSSFSNAPFRVTPEGKATLSNVSITGGSISWSNVNSDPVATGASSAAAAANSAAITAAQMAQLLANGDYKGGTFINEKEVRSANIIGGTITGGVVNGATINGGDINVSSTVEIGHTLSLNGRSYSGGIIWNGTRNQIYIDPAADALHLTSNGGVYANGRRIDVNNVAIFG